MNEVYRGVLLSLGGNIAVNLGHHIKVFGQHNSKKLSYSKTKSIFDKCNKKILYLIIGYFLFIGGSIVNAYSLAFAPQTLLACIGSIQFVVNLLCSALFYGHHIRFIHVLGTFAVIMGCLTIVFGFSPKNDDSMTNILDLFDNFNTIHYQQYLIIVVIIFVSSLCCQYIGCMPESWSATQKISPKQQVSSISISWFLGLFYSLSSAMTGTQSVVLGKTLAIIIRNFMAGHETFFQPFNIYKLMFIFTTTFSWLITILFWLWRQHESMTKFDPVFIVPMNQVMWITFSTIAGGIFFKEFASASKYQWFALIGGLCLNYVGLFHLVPDIKKFHVYSMPNTEPLRKTNSMIIEINLNDDDNTSSR